MELKSTANSSTSSSKAPARSFNAGSLLKKVKAELAALLEGNPSQKLSRNHPSADRIKFLRTMVKALDTNESVSAQVKKQEDAKKQQEHEAQSKLLALRVAYVREHLRARPPAIIGFAGRVKKTTAGEARPTLVGLRYPGPDGETVEETITIEVQTHEALLAAGQGIPLSWGEPFEAADLEEAFASRPEIHPAHWQIVAEATKTTPWQLALPTAFEAVRADDIVITAEGSINDPFVSSLLLSQPELLIYRTGTGNLKALRDVATAPTDGKPRKRSLAAEKLEDHLLLARVGSDTAELARSFHRALPDDLALMRHNMNFRAWLDAQGDQVAATQRAHQLNSRKAFIDTDARLRLLTGTALEVRGLRDPSLEVLLDIEANRKADMEQGLQAVPEYVRLLADKAMIDGIGPALGGRLIAEIGNIKRFIKSREGLIAEAHAIIDTNLRATQWNERLFPAFWAEVETALSPTGTRTMLGFMQRRSQRRVRSIETRYAALEARLQVATDAPIIDHPAAAHYRDLEIKDLQAELARELERLTQARQTQEELSYFLEADPVPADAVVRLHEQFEHLIAAARTEWHRFQAGETKHVHYNRLNLQLTCAADDTLNAEERRQLTEALQQMRAAANYKRESLRKTVGSVIAYAGLNPKSRDAEDRPIPLWERHIRSKASGDARNNGELRKALYLVADQANKRPESILGRVLLMIRAHYLARHPELIEIERQRRGAAVESGKPGKGKKLADPAAAEKYTYRLFGKGHNMNSCRWQLCSAILAWYTEMALGMKTKPGFTPTPFDVWFEGQPKAKPVLPEEAAA